MEWQSRGGWTVKRIANAEDQADLQSDLDHLVTWCKDSLASRRGREGTSASHA